MERNERLYPISEEKFNETVLPVIEGNYIWKGRPPIVALQSLLRDPVHSADRLSVAGLAGGIRLLARGL